MYLYIFIFQYRLNSKNHLRDTFSSFYGCGDLKDEGVDDIAVFIRVLYIPGGCLAFLPSTVSASYACCKAVNQTYDFPPIIIAFQKDHHHHDHHGSLLQLRWPCENHGWRVWNHKKSLTTTGTRQEFARMMGCFEYVCDSWATRSSWGFWFRLMTFIFCS